MRQKRVPGRSSSRVRRSGGFCAAVASKQGDHTVTARKYFPIALFIGIQAFVIQIVDQALHSHVPPAGNGGFGWIAFQAWAVYFMAGGTTKGGVRSFIGYFIGMVASIAILAGSGIVGTLGFYAAPIVLLILVPIILYLDIAPDLLSFVPAVFVGAGVFFGMMTYVPGATFTNVLATESIYCVLGLIFGWATIAFRIWYEGRFVRPASTGIEQ